MILDMSIRVADKAVDRDMVFGDFRANADSNLLLASAGHLQCIIPCHENVSGTSWNNVQHTASSVRQTELRVPYIEP